MNNRIPTAYELFLANPRYTQAELEEAERLFFMNVIMKNGTFKTTTHRRLDDLNAAVNDLLPRGERLEIMDVAVSSGVSTAEWAQSLDERNVVYSMVAGDISIDAYLLSIGRRRVLVDAQGFAIQFDFGGVAARTSQFSRADKRSILQNPLSFALLKSTAETFSALVAADGTPPPRFRNRFGMTVSCQPLQLISRSLRQRTNITLISDDILNDRRFAQRFHVLRAANIVNRGYFPEVTLSAMIDNLRGRIAPNGLFVLCRTLDLGKNHGTIFRLSPERRLRVIGRIGEGSEVESLAL